MKREREREREARKRRKRKIKIERRRENERSDGSDGGRWWVARALAELLPAVTMVTGSHGACVVQPVSVRLGVWGVKCVWRVRGSGVTFLFLFYLSGEHPTFISRPAEEGLT